MADDKHILGLYRNGDKNQAFNLLVREYGERLYWHIRRLVVSHEDADDLLQNTYIKIWNSLDTFREDARLFTWLYRIATNEALTFLHRRQIVGFLSFEGMGAYFEKKLKQDDFFSGDQLQMALHKAISKLPPKQKVVFCMRYFEERKYEEIAEVLDTSVGSLKASYHHAYNKVVEDMKNSMGV